ncbi:hypothetical protein FQR65_LT16279 [Abscondita terminalis]|nr:hypothetical protein FQR65_LT16279 [Abscondita terminalis]
MPSPEIVDKIDVTELKAYPCAFAIAEELPKLKNDLGTVLNKIFKNSDKLRKDFRQKTNRLQTKVEKQKKLDTDWEKVDYDKIKDKVKEVWNIESDMTSEWGWDITPENKTFEYQVVKKIDGNYYAAKNCLTESPLIAPYGTINISEPKVSIKQMKEVFKNRFPDFPFPLDIDSIEEYLDISFSLHNYFSKEYIIKGKKAFQFWTLDGWTGYQDGLNEYRGIDRFVYIPEKGIVGGSYDFYFRKFNVLNTLLWDNIINEKVMIAEELK